MTDVHQRARIGAVYNIFAFAAFIPLIFVLPRLTDSLHPGNGGNPGFNAYDLDSKLRMVFYPAIIAWTLMGTWISSVRVRLRRAERKIEDRLINQVS
jgi:heme exporter protein C